MSAKQFFARVGVFLLLVVNLGAYYFFWPERGPRNGPAAERETKGTNKPSLFAARDGNPGQMSGAEESSVTVAGNLTKATKRDELPLSDLASPPAPTAVAAVDPALPAIPDVGLPRPPAPPGEASKDDPTLELLKKAKDPGHVPEIVEGKAPADERPRVAAKSESSPWSLQMDITDGQTVLTARLHKSLEIRIHCQRVEMKTPDGSVLALGQVSVVGPGLKASCQRLTLPLHDDRLLLDGQAEVAIEQRPAAQPAGEFYRAGGPSNVEMKGDKLSLRLPPPPAAPQSTAPVAPPAVPGAQPPAGFPATNLLPTPGVDRRPVP